MNRSSTPPARHRGHTLSHPVADIHKRKEDSETRAAIEALSKLREGIEKQAEIADKVLKLRTVMVTKAAVADNSMFGPNLRELNKKIVNTHKALEGLNKIIKVWTYVDLTQQAFLAKKASEREKARRDLGVKLVKETKPIWIDLGKEVGALFKTEGKESIGAFLARIGGRKLASYLVYADVPIALLMELFESTPTALEIYDIAHGTGGWSAAQAQDVIARELPYVNDSNVKQLSPVFIEAMANVLAKQKQERANEQAFFEQMAKFGQFGMYPTF